MGNVSITSDFKWLNPHNINLGHYNDYTKKGIILEVDLEYPNELHDSHNSYPCAPEKMVVSDQMLSPYCKSLKEANGISSGKVKKLVPNLLDRKICLTLQKFTIISKTRFKA